MDRKIIGKRLSELRAEKTQKEVAEAIGVKQSTYSMYESGERIPSDEVKIKIARYYKKTVQFIFYS